MLYQTDVNESYEFCSKSSFVPTKNWAFFDFNTDFLKFFSKITQKGSFLPILSRFLLIFVSDKRHSQRASRRQKVSKRSKNGGGNSQRYIYLSSVLDKKLFSTNLFARYPNRKMVSSALSSTIKRLFSRFFEITISSRLNT